MAQIYIPFVSEQMVTSSGSSDGSSTTNQNATMNMNQASESELDVLPCVGPVTAQKIISNRPYQSVQDLFNKKVIRQSEFGKIKDMVSVY